MVRPGRGSLSLGQSGREQPSLGAPGVRPGHSERLPVRTGLRHRYASGYLALRPTDASAEGIRLADTIIRTATRRQDVRRLATEASPSALHYAWLTLDRVADSLESDVEVTRALAAAPEGDAPWLSPIERQIVAGSTLLYRGHVREAGRILFQSAGVIPPVLIEAALLTPELPDSTERVFRSWFAGGPAMRLFASLPLWVARGDSATLRTMVHRSDSVARSAPSQVDRDIARYVSNAAVAYLTLMRRDTAAALRRFEALPDSLCPLCYYSRLTLAQLLSARHEDQKAASLMDRWLTELKVPSTVLWRLEHGRVAERLGRREEAIRDYQYVADVWRHADPVLEPYVEEAREGSDG